MSSGDQTNNGGDPRRQADSGAFPEADHDHRRCVERMMSQVEHLCVARGLRLTTQRRRVLDVVAASHAAIGAYEILARMSSAARASAPISVYRALDFLMQHGLVHRVESLNAYVACARVRGQHSAQFLVCSGCRRVVELESAPIADAIAADAEAASFAITQSIVEITGRCDACRSTDA